MTQETGTKRYSEAFKRQVVQEYEAGSSINQLRRKYRIGGSTTIQKWIRRYSHKGLRGDQAVSMPAATSSQLEEEVQRLRQKIAWLEKAIADLTVDKLLLQTTLEMYQEAYGVEVAKKNGLPSSSKSTRRARGR